MSVKTVSEKAFEEFCAINRLACEKIQESSENGVRTPDYKVTIQGQEFVFEIKQFDQDIRNPDGSWTLTPGELIRKAITKKNSQVKKWAEKGFPTILLVFNNFDQNFRSLGTDQHDFITAMYGEMTVLIDKTSMKIVDSFHGRNSKCQTKSNTSFSAIGGIYQLGASVVIRIYENIYAKVPINYASLPSCFEVHKIP
jgi:hypothetical protein